MDESQVEQGWEEASVPGKGNGRQRSAFLCLSVSPTMSDRVGGNGSEIAGQEAKAGKARVLAHSRAYFLFPRA